MILQVGLTGGIASGKSTVVRILAGLGCVTVDADAIVARLYEPGEAGHETIVEAYGPDVLSPDGEIDRNALAARAFSSPEEAKRLNALIHPLVITEEARMLGETQERLGDGDAVYVVEATLLLEAGGRARYDRLVVVDLPPELQIARAVQRGMAEEEVRRRIAHQMPREERLSYADYIIDNSGDETAAERETLIVYELLRADLEAKKKSPGLSPGADSKNS